jgi:hypothetical protein
MQAAAQSAEGLWILVVLGAIAIVVFWRVMLLLILTTIIAVLGYGAFAVWQNMHPAG